IMIVLLATIAGAPVFVAMTGIAIVLFFREGTSISAVSTEVFRLLGSPTLPAIPLLTGTGYVLAESKASQRLVRVLRSLLGGLRGGMAVSILVLLALFTTLTGGSGVTILALGGLAHGILREDGQEEGFSLGLVTTAGSLGLLFWPSIPVILYAVVASVPADLLYIGGAVPGILMLVVVAVYAVVRSPRRTGPKVPFSGKEFLAALRAAAWDLTIPVVVLALFFSGLASMVEAAAAAFAWTIIVECFITRDIHAVRDLPRVLRHAGILVGAVLLLLASALGFTGYLVDAQIPDALVAFATAHVHSKWVFLLVLNGALLILGSVFEIFAAIVVLAPIVAPLGAAFGVNPVHLGVVFLANLELGFLLPPAGLNLFLSASRFKVPLPKLYRVIVPFLLILAAGVLLITYATPMTEGVLALLGKS
ncbi:MAG: TRAP transporter large permease, partial [Stellaceae bacterium]